MMRAVVPASFLLLALAGCGEGDADASSTQGGASPRPAAAASTAGTAGLRIRAVVVQADSIEPIVEARGDAPVRIGSALSVESESSGRFTRVDVTGLSLRPDCGTEAPRCIELARGGGLRPPAWNARLGAGQCVGPTVGAPVPNGTYRFVATACEGGARVEGEPFRVAR